MMKNTNESYSKALLEEALRLKTLDEQQVLEEAQAQEIQAFMKEHEALWNISIQVLRQLLLKQNIPTAESGDFLIQSDDHEALDSVMADYMKMFRTSPDGAYPSGYAEPKKDKDGLIHLSFPTDELCISFLMQQAEKNRAFVVMDDNRHVLAYSKGDGHLCHPDGTQFKPGDAFQPSTCTVEDFKMPGQAPKPKG